MAGYGLPYMEKAQQKRMNEKRPSPWYAHNNCCQLCNASKVIPRLFYTEFDWNAGWRRERITHEMYLGMFEGDDGDEITPFASIIGFHLETLWIDSMHCMDSGNGAFTDSG